MSRYWNTCNTKSRILEYWNTEYYNIKFKRCQIAFRTLEYESKKCKSKFRILIKIFNTKILEYWNVSILYSKNTRLNLEYWSILD